MRFLGYTIGDPSAPAAPPTPEEWAEMAGSSRRPPRPGSCWPPAAWARRGDHQGRPPDGKITVIDGPFTEAKELVGGWALMECRDKAEAIEWARRFLASPATARPGCARSSCRPDRPRGRSRRSPAAGHGRGQYRRAPGRDYRPMAGWRPAGGCAVGNVAGSGLAGASERWSMVVVSGRSGARGGRGGRAHGVRPAGRRPGPLHRRRRPGRGAGPGRPGRGAGAVARSRHPAQRRAPG